MALFTVQKGETQAETILR